MANKRQKKKQFKAIGSCALCGRPLPRERDQRVVGNTGRGVCAECLFVARRITVSPTEKKAKPTTEEILTPQMLMERLDKAIIGQERAKRAVVVSLWKQQLRAKGYDIPNPGLLLFGPTGCGKTALAREAAKAAGLPFVVCDATTLSETGYKGKSATDIIEDLKSRYDGDVSCAVVYLDEIDKLSARGNETRKEYSRGTQHSLLKLVEGTEVDGISTERMLFLFSGAFTAIKTRQDRRTCRAIGFDREEIVAEEESEREPIPADFIAYGMEAELMGRISRCVPVRPLTEDDLRRILRESNLSHFRKYQMFFQSRGAKLELDEEAQEHLIRKTLEQGLGARGLNALLEEWVEPKLLELAEVEHGRI